MAGRCGRRDPAIALQAVDGQPRAAMAGADWPWPRDSFRGVSRLDPQEHARAARSVARAGALTEYVPANVRNGPAMQGLVNTESFIDEMAHAVATFLGRRNRDGSCHWG